MSNFNLIQAEVPQRKVFYQDGNSNVIKKKFTFPKYYTSQEVKATSLQMMYSKFQSILSVENAATYSIIRGEWLSDDDLEMFEEMRLWRLSEAAKVGRDPLASDLSTLLRDGKKGKKERLRRKSMLLDKPHHWVCFDFDGLEIEGLGEFDVSAPENWVNAAILQELGPEFALSDYILQLSSSAGLSEGIRAHAWFWLSEPMDGAAWRAWYAERTAALGRKPAVDKSLFDHERVHFIAPPEFVGATPDPCEGAARVKYVEMLEPFVDLEGISRYKSASAAAAELRAAKGIDVAADGEREAAQDAWGRPGIVGAFNRVFSVSETIERFLPEHYQIATAEGRVTWLGSDSGAAEGNRIFANNTKMFSTHSSDPFGGEPRNAFDLVEHWLHGGDFRSAAQWAESIPEVKAEVDRSLADDFDDFEPADGFEWEVVRAEKVERTEKKPKLATAEDIMREYPMPEYWGGGPARYKFDGSSWFYGYEKKDDDDDIDFTKKDKFIKLWSPITMVQELRTLGVGSVAVEFKVMGADGQPVKFVMPRRDFGRACGDLLSSLEELGWLRAGKGALQFAEYVSSTRAGQLKSSLRNRGWDDTNSFFATPGGEIIAAGTESADSVILTPDKTIAPEVARGGTMEAWQDAIGRILEYEACVHWPLAVASSFVGPLTKLIARPTCGMALCGESSFGKSTALMVGVSTWTTPDEGRHKDGGLFANMRGTSNSVEVHAERANHTLLVLDETGHISGKDLEALVFSLSAGTGKSRMNITGKGFRAANSWQTFVLMSGEHGLAQRFENETGRKMAKGVAARILDLNVDLLDNVRVSDSSPILDIHAALRANYGHAGPAFVQGLVDSGYVARAGDLEGRRKAIAKKIAPTYSGLEGRVADILSTVYLAAELCVEFGILPKSFVEKVWKAGEVVWGNFKASAPANKDQSVVDDVTRWIVPKLGSSIIPIDEDSKKYRETEAWYDNLFFYVPVGSLEKACGGVLREASIIRTLGLAGILIKEKPDRNISRYIPKVSRNYAHYRLSVAALKINLPESEFSESPNDD